ncbi:MAG: 50S ribosome-binding GTPase [Candidatus Lokiarchaeota archaeon]|nr:50S ribosome-binding GTPase [Candidatus Lokiarchaeota archaeon]
MKKLLSSSIIKAFVYCVHDEIGPQPKYFYPEVIPEKNGSTPLKREDKGLFFTFRDYMQIAIKNLSLLLTDELTPKKNEVRDFKYFAIIPYPDFNLTSLTFFYYLVLNSRIKPIETAFSILVEENKRNFLYNNYKQIQTIIEDFFMEFNKILKNGFITKEKSLIYFKKLLKNIIEIEKKPSPPASTQKKIKIILAGLDDSGKTSFLLAVDRKFSKLMGLKPTRSANVQSIQALGASIILWDLGGQSSLRKKYLTKSDIYLYESDLLLYFIDIKNKQRFEESLEYLNNINNILKNELVQNTPIIFILSKADLDIIDSSEIKKNIKFIKSKIQNQIKKKEIDIFTTSIFEISTILRAFSSGISKLSPNRNIIKHNLKKFSKRVGSYITLLLSNDGLVMADYYSYKAENLIDEDEEFEIIHNVFEITAPQFTMLYKIFYKFKALQKNEAIFKLANSNVIVKQLNISETILFILVLLDNNNNKKEIENCLLEFTERIKDLLIHFV